MHKLKKSVTTLVAALLVSTNVAGLTACGGRTNGPSTVDIVPYDGSAVEVTFYHTMGAALKGILDEYIPVFNEMYPNITIKHDMMGDYPAVREQIMTELSAGNSPSMAYCYPDHVALYKKAKKVLTLDDYIYSDEKVKLADGTETIMGYSEAERNDFISAYYEEGKAYGDDKMYTMPIMKSTEVLYYNKTEFDKKGWKVPETWEEMETLCATIKADTDYMIDKKDENGNVIAGEKVSTVIPLGYDSEANWFITMTEQLGTPYTSVEDDHFLFNTPENRAFVEKFRGWYEKGYVTTEEIFGDYTSKLFTEINPEKQKVFMCIGSSAGATYQSPELIDVPVFDENGNPVNNEDGTQKTERKYPFEVGVAMIPQANLEKPRVIQQGPSVCLFKKSNPQEMAAAWLFTKFLTTSIEYQASVSMNNGYTSVIKSVQQNEVYADFLNNANGFEGLQATAVKQTLAQMDYYYISPAFNGSSAARDKVGILLQNCLVGKLNAGQTAAQFIESQFKDAIEALEYDYA